ncbi:NAD(P)/FAD-dependent oxidoreductase [Pokkaliibacter sp. MBI-7]|uniref:FAD-dependent oxidoreductase n=1 Tax=Pokkaliibacter sp. MBI-7 TaxID=3040600 RepID=UPI00244C5BB3|nr:NAD(P)/FAD-dependent oxidoreductase [Pokkaliibacter sp. MBI-7]MDH2432995.1 NAD(P)/FAD-dependent oxidoreductase [Pokkaliibacter sp. MBI-7]
MPPTTYDIAIIGAGFAGSCLAWMLKDQPVRVALLDRNTSYPPSFRAEKLEQDQAELLSKFGLLDARQPLTSPIHRVDCYRKGQHYQQDVGPQYGIHYTDTVNQLRSLARKYADFFQSRVIDLSTSDTQQQLVLENGQRLQARLLVLATGGNVINPLAFKLGMRQQATRELRSLSFAFDIGRADGQPYDFQSFNYFLDPREHQIDYVTLFPIGDSVRINLFTQWHPKDMRVRAMRRSPMQELDEYFPGLFEQIGDSVLTGSDKVALFPTQYYQLSKVEQPGIVVIGDEFQSVSPATGKGLSKVLTDVDVLSGLIPQWLESEGIAVDKVQQFYRHPEKQAVDSLAKREWVYLADNALHPEIISKVKRKLAKLMGVG